MRNRRGVCFVGQREFRATTAQISERIALNALNERLESKPKRNDGALLVTIPNVVIAQQRRCG